MQRNRPTHNNTLDWQPIETAPRGETFILACRAGSEIAGVLGWDEDHGWYWYNDMFQPRVIPTHWMPLPKPPK